MNFEDNHYLQDQAHMVQQPASGAGGFFYENDKHGGWEFSASAEFLQNPPLPSLSVRPAGEDESSSGFQSSEVVSKKIKLTSFINPQDEKLEAMSELKPLGLTLSKTPSFVNLLEMKLSQPMDSNCPSLTMSEKLKASNFSASFLSIGSWGRKSENHGDLVAKCYFAKRKLVWEILEDGLKGKMEIPWSEILAIRATTQDNQTGILELELRRPPAFFQETSPQPRRHTMWQPSPDFTGGAASMFRRHYLKFPAGTLDKHYDKLLQRDNRLLDLSQRPFPSLASPYFDSAFGGFPKLHPLEAATVSLPAGPEVALTPQCQPQCLIVPTPMLQPVPFYHQPQTFQPTTILPSIPNHSTSTHSGYAISNNPGIENPNMFDANQIAAPSCQENQPLTKAENHRLQELAQHLLHDPLDELPDERQVLRKVESMNSLLGIVEESSAANSSTEVSCVDHVEGQPCGVLYPPKDRCYAAPQLVQSDIQLTQQLLRNNNNPVKPMDPNLCLGIVEESSVANSSTEVSCVEHVEGQPCGVLYPPKVRCYAAPQLVQSDIQLMQQLSRNYNDPVKPMDPNLRLNNPTMESFGFNQGKQWMSYGSEGQGTWSSW